MQSLLLRLSVRLTFPLLVLLEGLLYRPPADAADPPPWGYPPVGVCARGVIRSWGCAAVGGIKNHVNHYFGYQIRILQGRFTPGRFILEEFF